MVDEQAAVGDRPVGGKQDVRRPAEFEHQIAVPPRPADEGRGDMVGAARNHRDSGRQTEMARRRRGDGADDLMALADGREDGPVDAGQRQQPVVVDAVEEC